MGDVQKIHYSLNGPGCPDKWAACGDASFRLLWTDDCDKVTCTRCRGRLEDHAVHVPSLKDVIEWYRSKMVDVDETEHYLVVEGETV